MQRFYHNKVDIKKAAELLKQGELVAFPTETVYGLGAIANNDQAVKSVYQAKGRPSDNPLIVHLSSPDQIALVSDWTSKTLDLLIRKFWPGPLTLILPLKENSVAQAVTGGQNTIAVRMPNHQATLDLIEAVGFPLVGPSANRSGKPSPTTADHVVADLDGRISGVLDAGPSKIGLESTVLDLTDSQGPTILRPGAITAEMLEELIVLNPASKQADDMAPKSPGMKYRHYSPDKPVWMVDYQTIDQALEAAEGQKVTLIAQDDLLEAYKNKTANQISLGISAEAASQKLFAALRQADLGDSELIFVQILPEKGVGKAYMNRLSKASSKDYRKI